MICANLRPEFFQFFSLGTAGIQSVKEETTLQRSGRDLTELAAKAADGLKAETLKAEILEWESRKRWGGRVPESGTLATAWWRWRFIGIAKSAWGAPHGLQGCRGHNSKGNLGGAGKTGIWR